MMANATAIANRNNAALVYYFNNFIVNNYTNNNAYYNSLYPTVVFVFLGAVLAPALLFGE